MSQGFSIHLNEHKKLTQKMDPVKRTILGDPGSSQKANNPSQLLLTMLYRTIMVLTGMMQTFFAKNVTQKLAISEREYPTL